MCGTGLECLYSPTEDGETLSRIICVVREITGHRPITAFNGNNQLSRQPCAGHRQFGKNVNTHFVIHQPRPAHPLNYFRIDQPQLNPL